MTPSWVSFLGLTDAVREGLQEVQQEVTGASRPKSRGKLEEAVADFFSAWLIERKPEQAAGYFSRVSLGCLELWREL